MDQLFDLAILICDQESGDPLHDKQSRLCRQLLPYLFGDFSGVHGDESYTASLRLYKDNFSQDYAFEALQRCSIVSRPTGVHLTRHPNPIPCSVHRCLLLFPTLFWLEKSE